MYLEKDSCMVEVYSLVELHAELHHMTHPVKGALMTVEFSDPARKEVDS